MAEGGTPGAPASGQTSADYQAAADALRDRVDLFGKTLAAVATLGTSAVGLSKIGDLFPAGDQEEWVWIACVALAAAALAAVWISVRLMKVARPVFMRPDLDNNEELSDGERAAVRPVFEASARRYGYTSLVGLQERERSLRSAAAWSTDEGERARRTARADEVRREIEDAMARGQVVTVRRRAIQAVSAPISVVLYVTVVAGLVLFAVGTDKVSSARVDLVAQAKACGEARTAGATPGELAATGKCEGEPGAGTGTGAEAEAAAATALPRPEGDEASVALRTLKTAKPLSMTGYRRARFPHWVGQGRGCNTRKVVLIRDGDEVAVGSRCRIDAGRWLSFYDAKTMDRASQVDIDHVVPLAEAWRSGAKRWSDARRRAFANDLDDSQLLAVSASSNRSKGDKGPARWKPPRVEAHCLYARWWVQVKERWRLTVTADERAELGRMLAAC